jgi:hypothetical protein
MNYTDDSTASQLDYTTTSPAEGILSVADMMVDTLNQTPAEAICPTEAPAEKPITVYPIPIDTDDILPTGRLPMPSPLQRKYSTKSLYVACSQFLPFHSQAYMATVGRMPGAYERATGDALWKAYKRMPTTGHPVAFTAISAATGGGKTVGACALMAHLVFTEGASCAYIVETIEGAEEARRHLETLLPGRVACFTSIHRADARPEKVRDYAAMNVVAGSHCTEDQFKAAQVVVCTHERWKLELVKGVDVGVRKWKGKDRTLVVVDEEPELQVTYVQQPEDVALLLSVLSDTTLRNEARHYAFTTHHVAAPCLQSILNRMIDIKSNANVPQLYTADLVSADDLDQISRISKAAALGKISPALLGIISPVWWQSLAHDLEPRSLDGRIE